MTEPSSFRDSAGNTRCMNATTSIHRLCVAGALGLLVLAGCDPEQSSLGELPQEETTDTSSTDTGSDTTSVVGAPCELSQIPLTILLDEVPNEVCGEENFCHYPVTDSATVEACTSDEMCGGQDGMFYCDLDTNRCVLDPSFIAARSMCTQACETAADCEGVDGTLCESGFSCEPVTSLGSSCCQTFCVCNDDLDVIRAADLRHECETGQLSPNFGCP